MAKKVKTPESVDEKKAAAKKVKAERAANKARKVAAIDAKAAALAAVMPDALPVQHTTAPVYFMAENIRYEFKAHKIVFGDSKGRTHTVSLTEHGHHQWVSFTGGR